MKTEAPKFENRLANRRTGWTLAATLILAPALWSAGCATTSTPAVESTAELGPSDPTAVASAKPKVPERQVSEDQKDDFDKAVARYEKLSKGGPLKGGDCDDAADAFRKVADANPNLLEARHDQAAVLAECGREAEAARIWEKLAEGKRPYSPALSSLGYLAWQKGDAAGAERYFTRAI